MHHKLPKVSCQDDPLLRIHEEDRYNLRKISNKIGNGLDNASVFEDDKVSSDEEVLLRDDIAIRSFLRCGVRTPSSLKSSS